MERNEIFNFAGNDITIIGTGIQAGQSVPEFSASGTGRPGWSPEDNQNPLFEDPRLRYVSHTWRPPTDVYETDTAIVVRVEIAGMRETDFTISLVERSLIIKGTRQEVNERRAYYQMEIPFGEFSTEVDLPYPIIAEEIEAVYRDGFLRIVMPKARPQQIKISG
jgi:HSP20 family protein